MKYLGQIVEVMIHKHIPEFKLKMALIKTKNSIRILKIEFSDLPGRSARKGK